MTEWHSNKKYTKIEKEKSYITYLLFEKKLSAFDDNNIFIYIWPLPGTKLESTFFFRTFHLIAKKKKIIKKMNR